MSYVPDPDGCLCSGYLVLGKCNCFDDVEEIMKPTVGRIVHYTNLGDKDGKYPPETQAAIITKVYSDVAVALTIFYKTGFFLMDSVPFAEEPTRGHWNWPARV